MKHRKWFLALVELCLFFNLCMVGQENRTVTSQARQVCKTKHSAVKDDIQAIGSRNIGGKGISNWYSIEKEIGIGREYSKEIESRARMLRDPVITEYVNRIGQNLVRNSDAKVPFAIKVIDSDEINAFALPGGF